MNYAQRKRYRSWAKAVARSLARALEKNHRTLAKKLGSDRYEGLILALKHWIAAGPWLSNRLPFRSARLEVFSSARLRDWSAAISRKGRKLGALRRQQLHRVRIRAKHYRYCIDALQELGQRFLGSKSYQAASASLYDQVWMTGWRFTSSMPAIMRSLSSCFEVTRMWRRTDRANLEKKPSMRLSHEPCLGVKVNSKRPGGRASSQALVSLDMCAE